MPRYLIEASYGAEGVRGVAQKGGSARREIVGQLIGSMGGAIESFYFAFGDPDVYVIAELPSDEAAAAIALSINQTAATKTRTVVLLTPEQIDTPRAWCRRTSHRGAEDRLSAPDAGAEEPCAGSAARRRHVRIRSAGRSIRTHRYAPERHGSYRLALAPTPPDRPLSALRRGRENERAQEISEPRKSKTMPIGASTGTPPLLPRPSIRPSASTWSPRSRCSPALK